VTWHTRVGLWLVAVALGIVLGAAVTVLAVALRWIG
jgi:hypothetical protein